MCFNSQRTARHREWDTVANSGAKRSDASCDCCNHRTDPRSTNEAGAALRPVTDADDAATDQNFL